MMNILKKIKISYYTYLFLLLCLFSGFIKNIIIIYFICLFHELGHIIFIKFFHYKIISISISPFGGYTLVDKKINSSINKDIIIAFGGIFLQIILFLLIFIFKNNINIITYNLILKYNLILIIFNMLPIIPLDGSNVLNLLLERKISYMISYRINIAISCFFLIIFFAINIIYNLDNYFIFGFLIFKTIEKGKNYKYYKNRFLLERYLYDVQYKKIDNNTKRVEDIKKEVYHYFKKGKIYVNEKEFIKNKFFIQ